MKILREVVESDFEDLMTLAHKASLGVTNLPKNEALLRERLDHSLLSFEKAVAYPRDEQYIFVLEDLETKKVVGTSSIIARSPLDYPAPYFKMITEHAEDVTIPHVKEIPVLKLHFDESHPTELCALFLDPSERHGGFGRLLSLGRCLFIADHLKRFTQTVFADLRGVIHDNGECPFWETIIRYFCPVTYEKAIEIYLNDFESFVRILPKHPIYISLLPFQTQEVIGSTHTRTIPAIKMLESEGFYLTNDVHPLDGGARVIAPMNEVRSVQDGKLARVEVFDDNEGDVFIVSNAKRPFRAALGTITELSTGGIALSKSTASALQIHKNDMVRYVKEKA